MFSLIFAHPPYTLLLKRLLSRFTFRVARTQANDVPAIDVSESSLTVKVKSDGRGSTILFIPQLESKKAITFREGGRGRQGLGIRQKSMMTASTRKIHIFNV